MRWGRTCCRTRIRNSKLPAAPPRFWLNFLATTGRRARFITAHENHGEVLAERTDDRRFFDLRATPVFTALADRLVIEWTKDAVNWVKTGDQAVGMTVVEIADPSSVAFPGFDSLLVSYDELQAVITDDRYGQWRTALSSVQGIYVIADTLTGKLYAGKADGVERFLSRWSEGRKCGSCRTPGQQPFKATETVLGECGQCPHSSSRTVPNSLRTGRDSACFGSSQCLQRLGLQFESHLGHDVFAGKSFLSSDC